MFWLRSEHLQALEGAWLDRAPAQWRQPKPRDQPPCTLPVLDECRRRTQVAQCSQTTGFPVR